MREKILGGLTLVVWLGLPSGLALAQSDQDDWKMPRTADGHPDLTGMYDTATLTPLQRPVAFGDKLFLTAEEAAAIEDAERLLAEELALSSDPERRAPPEGGDGSPGPYGNVGGYNFFWIDRGTEVFELEGKQRTSIIVDPANGRMPPLTPEAARLRAARAELYRENAGHNDGEAWWLELDGPGPYDDPEQRPLGERCLLGFGSTSGPPSLPVLYNNFKRIVQTRDHVMILVEMVHDARIIRMNREHLPSQIRKWMGDSVGHWDGDTLVVDTTNFTGKTGLRGNSDSLHVVERFTRVGPERILYQFTVEDPNIWTRPWSGEYPWVATEDQLFEYACHEANYSFEGILKGARLLEAEAKAAKESR